MRSRVAHLVVALELPLLLAIWPAFLFPTPLRMVVLVAVPVIWLCAHITTGSFVPSTPLNVALWTLLATVALSLAATFSLTFSLGKVAGVLFGVLLFWAAVRWTRSPRRLALAAVAFIFAGSCLGILGLVGTQVFIKFASFNAAEWFPTVIRGIPGAETGFNPNAVAGSLVLFIPLQVAMLQAKVQERLWPAGSIVCKLAVGAQLLLLVDTLGTVIVMQSRGAWMGLLLGGTAWLAWYSRRTRIVACTVAGVLPFVALVLQRAGTLALVVSHAGPNVEGTVAGRLELWSRALYGIHDFPLTGMGMNAFRKIMPVVYPTFLISPELDIPHAHNHLLQSALDLGLPGLIAYQSIWLVTAALLVMVYRRSSDVVYRAMASGIGVGLIAHFTFGLTDAIPLGAKVGVLFWMALALAAALHQVALHSPAVKMGPAPS